MSKTKEMQVDCIKFKYPYPLRPTRKPNEQVPGTRVKLISNLFKMSFKQKLPIYEYCIEINAVEIKDSDSAGDELKAAKKPRKLPAKIRFQILDQAIKAWIQNNHLPGINCKDKFNYVSDFKVSVIYTLFNIFPKGDKNFKIELMFEEDYIEGKGLIKKSNQFVISFSKGSIVDFNKILKICQTGQTTTAEAKDLLRAVNTIVTGHMVILPDRFWLTNSSVFPKHQKFNFEVDKTTTANRGIFLSSKFVASGVGLTIGNTLATILKPTSLVEFVRSTLPKYEPSKPMSDNQIAQLKKELKNKQVEAKHYNYGTEARPHHRKYRIDDIGFSAMHKFPFVASKTETPKEITIKDYFKKEYRFDIKYPNLPCIITGNGAKIPFEVCVLVDSQRITRKNTPNETKNIITKTAVPALEHFNNVKENAQIVKDHSKPMDAFGLEFPLESIRLEGRELRAMNLIGGSANNKTNDLFPKDGGYNTNSTNFLKPIAINRWAIVFLADQTMPKQDQNLGWKEFADYYVKAGAMKGVSIAKAPAMKYFDVTCSKFELIKQLKEFFKFMNEKSCDHCIFVLPKIDVDWLYPYLQYLEALIKLPNKKSTRISCIKFENYLRKVVQDRSRGSMFLSNLLLKYNTKLGGVNFAIKPNPQKRYLSSDWLYISVDVCHPAPNDKLLQSVVGVVGMWDITSPNMSFCTRLRVQKKCNEKQSSTIEEVLELGPLFQEVVQSFHKRKGKLPSSIVIMRDGVSDGQLDIVIERELNQVLTKLNLLKNLKPKLTCLVVQKRHKQRFMREEPFTNFKGEKDYNIQPGTVIDNTVVHPTHHTFYLSSHKAIKGTSRPAHIYFRYDEIGFGIDEAQEMILTLSYLSPRCTKSTSIPTPVNLADLAAERGKNLVVSWNDDNQGKMAPDDRIKKLNEFLSQIGDPDYRNSLFYI